MDRIFNSLVLSGTVYAVTARQLLYAPIKTEREAQRLDHVRKRIIVLNARVAQLSDVYHNSENHRAQLAAGQQIRAALRAIGRYEQELIQAAGRARPDHTLPIRIGDAMPVYQAKPCPSACDQCHGG